MKLVADDRRTLKRMRALLVSDGILASGGQEDEDADVDVVVLTCDLSLHDPRIALQRLRDRADDARVVVASPRATGAEVRSCVDAGADGVVLLSELETTLAVTVRAVAAGQGVLPRELRRHALKPILSYRERQVLSLVIEGLTNRQIADDLYLAESTVKSHLSSLFAKLGVRSRQEATALVLDSDQSLRANLVPPGAPSARRRGSP